MRRFSETRAPRAPRTCFKNFVGRWRRDRAEKRAKRREDKRKAREALRTELKHTNDVAYEATRAIKFVVLAKNVVEASAVQGAVPSAFMSGVQKAAREDDDAALLETQKTATTTLAGFTPDAPALDQSSLPKKVGARETLLANQRQDDERTQRQDVDAAAKKSAFEKKAEMNAQKVQKLAAWLPPHRALLRADWRALACSALDRGDAQLLDALSSLRVVDDPVPRGDAAKAVQAAADKALRDVDDGIKAARAGLRGKEVGSSERGLLLRSKAARTVFVRLVRDAGEEVSPARLRDQYARLIDAPAELAAACTLVRAEIEAGTLNAEHLVLVEAACEAADAAARALPLLFKDLCRAALEATDEHRRRDVLERFLLENDGRNARTVVAAAGSSDWLYSVLKTDGGALEAFPFGLWHIAVMGCRCKPDTRDVQMQQRSLFENRPAWERALEMRVRGASKSVPDRVKLVLANVATRARLAALGKRVGAGARMQRDSLGRTGLAVAVSLGRPRDVIMACCDDSREADALDNLGWLPQHHAALRCDNVALGVVLDAATKCVDFPTPSGHTALHIVAASRAPLVSRLACTTLLLRRYASPNRRSASGLSALDLLVHAPVAKWTITTRAVAAAAAEETIVFLATNVLPDMNSPTAAQCFAVAGFAGDIRTLDSVKTPLAADLRLANEFDAADAGVTSLHVARSADVVKALVEKGANVSALTVRERECALHYATRSDTVNVVVALLEAGAKAGPRFANAHGESPRDVAVPGSKARKAMDERTAALRAERGRRAVGVHATEDWPQTLLALDREGKFAALRKDVASAKVRQTLTSAAGPEVAGATAAAVAPEAALTSFLDASTPVKLIGQAFTTYFQMTPADRATTLRVLKDVAQKFKAAPHTRVFLAPSRAGGRACYLTGALVWQATEDVVEGLASTVVRVFAVDGGGADPVKFQQTLAQLFSRAAKSTLKNRGTVMPDPESTTGVAKWYRLTSQLAAVKAFRGTAGQPFELDGPEQQAVASFLEDPKPLLLNGRGGSGKSLIAYRVLVEDYDRARKAGRPPSRSVVVTGSSRLRDAFASQFDAYLRVTYPLDRAAAQSKALDVDALPPGPSFFTTDQLIDALDATLSEPFRRTAVVNRGVVETTRVGKPWLDAYEAKAGPCGPADLSEIFSVVKGSSDALAKGRPLSRDEYQALPRRDTSYQLDERRTFYGRYQRYEKALKGAAHHDSLDVVLYVAVRLSRKPLYDSLIVDEVQDFPEAKIGLLLRLTSNPSVVLFGGDTAHTIARTRFHFGKLADLLRRRVGVEPRNVELAVNYRSTQEVLDVSNVFVAALSSQFENHVDRLPREAAPFKGGFKVRLLRASDFETIGDIVLGDGSHTEVSEFGAQQCVIVPDEAAKQNLPPSFAGALCFTPLEAKGLEFHTVFLLDSFKKTNPAWWQALAVDGRFRRMIGEEDASTDAPPDPLLSSDLARVAELKQTYVGVTRACVRLFCIDTNEHGRRPFYDLLLKRGYARWHEGDLAMDEGLAVASERRKWRARGDELLARIKEGDETIADQAAMCFAKSGDAASEAFCRGVEWRRAASHDLLDAADLKLAAACAFARGGALEACAQLLDGLDEADLASECRNADGTARLLAEARAAEQERAETANCIVATAKQARLAARAAADAAAYAACQSTSALERIVTKETAERLVVRRAQQTAENKRSAEVQAARAAIRRAEAAREAEAAERRRAETARAEAARRETERRARAERLEKERLAQAQRDAERAEARRLAAIDKDIQRQDAIDKNLRER